MSDTEKHLRRYYESQALSDERVREILAEGRAAAIRRTRRLRWVWTAAAAIVTIASVLGLKLRKPSSGPLQPIDVAAAVVRYFSRPDYQLSAVSSDPTVLANWLRTHGGPSPLTIPAMLRKLPSFGCEVLETKGQKVYLMCFFFDGETAGTTQAGMPVKKQMVVTAPDGTTMMKDRPLVHLVAVPRAAFREPPSPGTRVRFAGTDGWSFETWSEDDVVYLVAAVAPAERLASLMTTL